MTAFIQLRDPPSNRRTRCTDGQERHLTEPAVAIAFAVYLLEAGATLVDFHPDGEHGKQYDIRGALEARGLQFVTAKGTTSYGGIYRRGAQTVVVTPTPGKGDVVAEIGGRLLVAECKGGVVNSTHAGQLSRLRRGLCEVVGLLMARQQVGERHVAVVPATDTTRRLAERMVSRTMAAGIELALVEEDGAVVFITPR